MQTLKNVFLNWILPVVVMLLVLVAVEEIFAPGSTTLEEPAPSFMLSNTDGEEVGLAHFRGQPLIVNFWATWCAPCKRELPTLNRFLRENREIAMVGIAVDSGDAAELARAKRQLGIEFPVLVGTSRLQSIYGVSSLPTTFLVDAEGTLRRRHVGIISERRLESWLEIVVPKPASSARDGAAETPDQRYRASL